MSYENMILPDSVLHNEHVSRTATPKEGIHPSCGEIVEDGVCGDPEVSTFPLPVITRHGLNNTTKTFGDIANKATACRCNILLI
jgi:hypothetical protein